MRAWRTRNRDVTYLRGEDKRVAKLVVERYNHVAMIVSELLEVQTRNPCIFEDSYRLWNIDKTAVSTETGKILKYFVTFHLITAAVARTEVEN